MNRANMTQTAAVVSSLILTVGALGYAMVLHKTLPKEKD